jgi:hypothetical protein
MVVSLNFLNWIYKINCIVKLTNFAMVLKKIAKFLIGKEERKKERKKTTTLFIIWPQLGF